MACWFAMVPNIQYHCSSHYQSSLSYLMNACSFYENEMMLHLCWPNHFMTHIIMLLQSDSVYWFVKIFNLLWQGPSVNWNNDWSINPVIARRVPTKIFILRFDTWKEIITFWCHCDLATDDSHLLSTSFQSNPILFPSNIPATVSHVENVGFFPLSISPHFHHLSS